MTLSTASPLAGGRFANLIYPRENAEIALLAQRLVEELRGQAPGYRGLGRRSSRSLGPCGRPNPV